MVCTGFWVNPESRTNLSESSYMWFPEALIGKPRLSRQPERPKKKMVKDCLCLTGVTLALRIVWSCLVASCVSETRREEFMSLWSCAKKQVVPEGKR